MRSEVELDIKEYTDVLKGKTEFNIPKSRNGRRLSAFGYAKSPNDVEYIEECNDGINGVSTANPSSQTLFMARMKQLETQDKLNADVNPLYQKFPTDQTPKDHPERTMKVPEKIHEVYPTQKKSILLRRTSLPLLTK